MICSQILLEISATEQLTSSLAATARRSAVRRCSQPCKHVQQLPGSDLEIDSWSGRPGAALARVDSVSSLHLPDDSVVCRIKLLLVRKIQPAAVSVRFRSWESPALLSALRTASNAPRLPLISPPRQPASPVTWSKIYRPSVPASCRQMACDPELPSAFNRQLPLNFHDMVSALNH